MKYYDKIVNFFSDKLDIASIPRSRLFCDADLGVADYNLIFRVIEQLKKIFLLKNNYV